MDKPLLWVPEQYLNQRTGFLKVPPDPQYVAAEVGEEQAPLWVIDEYGTKEHWLEVSDPDGYYEATVKWDGCVHLYMFDSPEADPEDDESETTYLHICELGDLIDRLQALKAIALEHFKGNWPG